jgi:hypothetical protein
MMDTHFDNAPAWPKNATPPAAVGSQPGHNRPSLDEEARSTFNDTLDQRNGFRQRIVDLTASADRATATDDDSLGRCGELVKQIRAATKVIEDTHKTTKQPYLDAGRVVDEMKNGLVGPLNAAKTKVEAKQNQYLNEQRQIQAAEARRIREVEEAQQQALADAAVANPEAVPAPVAVKPAPPPPAPVTGVVARGDYGAAVSAGTEWKSEVTDFEIAFIEVADNVKVREAISTAIQAMVRAGKHKIDGVRIWEQAKVSNR